MKPILGKVLWVGVAIVGVVALAGALLYAFRDPLATELLAAVLDRKQPDVRCNHPPVRIAASLQRLRLGPMHCEMRSGPLAAYRTESDTIVELDAWRVQSYSTERATLEQRDRDVSQVEYNTLGDLANLAGAQKSFVKGVLDAAEQYGEPSPPIRVETLTSKRAGKLESVQHGFVQSRDGAWDRTKVARAKSSGPQLVQVRDMDMRVTAQRSLFTAALYLGEPDPGERPDMQLKIEGSRLDGAHPRFVLSLEDPPQRSARASHVQVR